MNSQGQAEIFSTQQPITNWKEVLRGERESEYFKKLMTFIENERKAGKVIYPKNSDIFNALSFTPFPEVKVVIIGQDPYHGPRQAHGLCFSVLPGVPAPPSLLNIFKELQSDVGFAIPNHGCLEKWAKQGVMLLNTVLTVEAGRPQSHANLGWENFTDRVIRELNEKRENLVFLLWGSHAQKKGESINRFKHLVLQAPHPSPLSAHRGFLGCKHFSQTNEFLKKKGIATIDWSL